VATKARALVLKIGSAKAVTSNVIYLATIWIIPVLIAITFHEAAHGFVAHLLGGDMAWRLGRVSFNPVKHVDPVGTSYTVT
jgi:Zn-dependent protease